jgi:hypothetical protein
LLSARLLLPTHIFTCLGLREGPIRVNPVATNAALALSNYQSSSIATCLRLHAMDTLAYVYEDLLALRSEGTSDHPHSSQAWAFLANINLDR